MNLTSADRQLAAALADAHPIDALADMYDTLQPAHLSIVHIGADVRIVRYSSTVCFDGKDDIVVEQQTGGNWLRVRTFNSLSDDYASTNSRDYAHSLAEQLRRVVA